MSELRKLLESETMDPAVVRIMREAFDRACAQIENENSRSELIRTIAASRILRLAKAGERDPEKLYKAAVKR